MTLTYILISVIAISFISFLGALALVGQQRAVNRFMPWLVSFAAGTLLGVGFFDLLPETIELLPQTFGIWVIVGIISFLLFEQLLHWHHEHDNDCEDHDHSATGYTLLLGDTIHNFIDGVLIASAFLVNPALGIATTLGVALHEIPQEISDFAVLLHSGFSPVRALWTNFFSAFAAVAGGVIGYFALNSLTSITPIVLGIGTGGLLYISLVDLFSEVKSGRGLFGRLLRILAVSIGLLLMWGVTR